MKSIALIILLVFCKTVLAQYKDCNTKIFHEGVPLENGPNSYEWLHYGNNKHEMSDEVKSTVRKSLELFYTPRFADSCSIRRIIWKDEVIEDQFSLKIYFALSLPNDNKYEFGLDFNGDGTENFFSFPKIPDSLLLSKKANCSYAILAAQKDKVNPFKKIDRIYLLHYGDSYYVHSADELVGLYWVISDPMSKPNKKGISSAKVKMISFYNNKVVKRSVMTTTRFNQIKDELPPSGR